MNHLSSCLFYSFVVFLFLGPQSAQAWVQEKTTSGKGKFWRKLPIEYAIDAKGAGEYFQNHPKRGSVNSEFDAIQKGFQAWTTIQCNGKANKVKFQYIGTVKNKEIGFDKTCESCNTNLVKFIHSKTEWNHDNTRLAVTTTTFDESTGEIYDADIEVNLAYFKVSTQRVDTSNMHYDLQTIITHEVGHVLGLDHSTDTSATMYPSANEKDIKASTLADDDIDGICAIYPEDGKQTPKNIPEYKAIDADLALGCSARKSRASPDMFWLLFLLFFFIPRKVISSP